MSRKQRKLEEQIIAGTYKKKKIKRRVANRSIGGDIVLYLFLLAMAVLMAYPLVFAINAALKPLDEL